jgi:RNA polymerase sigma-70 factor (ECF subfamily)
MVLRRYEELSYEEIAVVLGVSVGSVKSLLFRARATLRELLAEYLN